MSAPWGRRRWARDRISIPDLALPSIARVRHGGAVHCGEVHYGEVYCGEVYCVEIVCAEEALVFRHHLPSLRFAGALVLLLATASPLFAQPVAGVGLLVQPHGRHQP